MSHRRLTAEPGFYHVTLRGNGKQIIFEDDADRQRFLMLMSERFADAGLGVLAWCLMDNHIHLLLRDDRGALSSAMRGVASMYARYFNTKTGHRGHVFQGRFQSRAVEDESYLLEAIRYVLNNPAAAGIISSMGT